ncbi:MAG: hypothetical protein GX567_03930, partial [Clostridia bacterium]|nr:hypothetical protein [Clostridia bacterium]
MKATDLTIAFILIIMPSVLMLDYKTKETNRAIYETTRISQILDAAVEDATAVMFEKDISGTVSINKDKGVNSLMQTMCLNFDLLDDDLSRRLIEGYIPCIVSIEYDGYCVMRHEEYLNEKNEPELRMTWLPKQPYSFSDTRYIYSFTLGDELTVYQKTSNAIINGTTDSLLTALPGSSILVAPDAYNTTEQRIEQFYLNKQIAMVEQLKRDIDEIINNHNRIAQHYGITYYFTLPDMEKDDWLS